MVRQVTQSGLCGSLFFSLFFFWVLRFAPQRAVVEFVLKMWMHFLVVGIFLVVWMSFFVMSQMKVTSVPSLVLVHFQVFFFIEPPVVVLFYRCCR